MPLKRFKGLQDVAERFQRLSRGFWEFHYVSGAFRGVLRGYRACFREGSEAPKEVSGVP